MAEGVECKDIRMIGKVQAILVLVSRLAVSIRNEIETYTFKKHLLNITNLAGKMLSKPWELFLWVKHWRNNNN